MSEDGVTERRRRWWLTAAACGLALAVAAAPAWCGAATRAAASAKSDQTRWAQRVRLVWRTHAHPWAYAQSEQHAAEKALLSEGRARAAAALKPMLARPLEDPLRLQAAFAMALLDLDHAAGRETLLRYLRSVRSLASGDGSAGVNWDRLTEAVADPEAPEDERRIGDSWEFPYFVHVVHKRHGDAKLLAGLLDLAPYADGELAEGMAAWLHEIARDNPRAAPRTAAPAAAGLADGARTDRLGAGFERLGPARAAEALSALRREARPTARSRRTPPVGDHGWAEGRVGPAGGLFTER